MNKINTMRAKLIVAKFHSSQSVPGEEMTFIQMLTRLLTVPSYHETECCTNSVQDFPIVYVDNDVLYDNLSNIQEAIEKNLAEIPTCARCKKKPQFEGKFGNHIFVEVSIQKWHIC